MANIVMAPGAAKVAQVPITVTPSGVVCELEVFTSPDDVVKTTTSGKITFTSTGAAQNVNCPITMPTTPAIYNVDINLTSSGVMVAGFKDVNKIAILGGTVGPIVWN